MTERIKDSADAIGSLDCISYRLRRAARIAARFYDNALRASGLRTTQFTLLASLNQDGEGSIGDLSERLGIDGTTLTRNLEILVRRGLVESAVAEDARVRNVRLTKFGKAAYDEALPLWRNAQQRALQTMGPEHWTEVMDQLRQIEMACEIDG